MDYAIPDLYLAASPESKTKLLTGFKAAPFVEPATGLAYFRARWYDPSTGTFLTPDPMGYQDSSNLYAAFANDPVNNHDPSGEVVETVWDAASLGMGITSFSYNMLEGNYGAATLDFAGIILDSIAVATPVLPGGVGALIKASRAGGMLAKAHFVDQTLNVGQAGIESYSAYAQGKYGQSAFYGAMGALGIRGMDASPFKWQVAGLGANGGNVRMARKASVSSTQESPLSISAALRMGGPNRGLVFVRENLGEPRSAAMRFARDFESSTPGAVSHVLSRDRVVPALRFENPDGLPLVRFDGFQHLDDGVTELIDAKTRIVPFDIHGVPFISSKVRRGLIARSQAITQNPGYRAVIELPDAVAGREARQVLRQLGITNIHVRVRSGS